MSNVVAGVVAGFLVVILSISNGSLLFAGELAAFVPVSVGLALFAAMAMSLVASATSSIRGVVIAVQEVSVVGVAAIALAVSAAMAPHDFDRPVFASVIVAVALATMSCGLISLLIGAFRLGGLIRFIPHPVMGGFLAGTGWLIVEGGVSTILSSSLSFQLLTDLSFASSVKLAAATAFVAALVIGQVRYPGPFSAPVAILAAVVAFNIVVVVVGIPTGALRGAGWLIALPVDAAFWPPIGMDDIALVDWNAVAVGLINLPTVLVLTVVAVLLNATGIGLQQREDVDLNRELVAVGWMNLAGGAGAGPPGFPALSITLLGNRLGGDSRLVGVVVTLMCLGALVAGGSLLALAPTFVFGGLLVWIGGQLVVEWLVSSYRRLDRWEHLVVLLIFLVIAGISFPVGITVGLAAAVVVFVVQYGQVDVVRHELTGTQHQSSADSFDHRAERLREFGDAILIIRLQGYLFFGTADRLRRRIHARLGSAEDHKIRYLVMDFARVTGLDSSTVISFIQLRQIAEKVGLIIVMTGVDARLRDAFARAGLHEDDQVLRIEADTQVGLKLAEDALLAELSPASGDGRQPIHDLLRRMTGDDDLAARIKALCVRLEVAPGDRLIAQDSKSDDVYFVESGNASVSTLAETGGGIRLATVGAGAVVGEVSFYLGDRRSATITAEEPMIVWRLPRDEFERLEASEPAAAMALHRGMARMLSQRVSQTNRLVRFLAD